MIGCRLHKQPILLGFAVCLAFLGVIGKSSAQSFVETLVAVYETNPQILAERARQRGADEGVARALGGWRPTVTLFGEQGRASDDLRQNVQPGNTTVRSSQQRSPLSAGVQIRQPIWDGGRTPAEIQRAEQNVLRGMAALEATEQQVLLEAIGAHADLARDIQIRKLVAENVEKLTEQRRIVAQRMLARDATRTDEAQADTRIARSMADREAADGALEVTRSSYMRVVGRPAGDSPQTVPPPPPNLLPVSLDEIRTRVGQNPELRAASVAIAIAEADVDIALSALRPDVSLRAAMRRLNQQDSPNFGRDIKEVLLSLNIPLYDAGVASARSREALHAVGQRQIELDQARRRVTDQSRRAWEQIRASRARIGAIEQQIRSGEIAVASLDQEVRVGTRTLTERLDAEQELLNARIELERSKREILIAQYQLLAALGRLDVVSLGLPIERYDPREHYNATRGRFFGTGILREYPENRE